MYRCMTTIRLVTPSDHAACAELFLRSRVRGFYWLPPSTFRLEDYESLIVDEEVWVAEKNGKIVGFCSLFLEENFLHNLFVDPSEQRTGVGSLLLEKFLERVQRPALLKCLEANQRALAFYQKHGWERLERGEEEFGAYWALVKR
jgi:GNAT superfamily N-acetyltransferase